MVADSAPLASRCLRIVSVTVRPFRDDEAGQEFLLVMFSEVERSLDKQIGDERASGDDLVRSTTRTSVGDVSVLNGLAVVKVASPVTMTATAGAGAGQTTYSNPAVTVTVAGATTTVRPVDGRVGFTLGIPGVLTARLGVTAFAPTTSTTSTTADADLDGGGPGGGRTR